MLKITVTASVALLFASTAASAAVYYVDYENGEDANSGKSQSAAWKHAPGDLQATGVPAGMELVGGDIVRFRAGIAYRGSIRLKYSGTDAEPITYTGRGWGTGRAIIDGADPVTSTVDCPSQAACGGAENWANLKLVTFDKPETSLLSLFDRTGPLYEAQYPAASHPFWYDEISSYVVTPRADAAKIETGRLENAALAARARPGAALSFWVSGNLVARRTITSVSGNTIFFDPGNLKLYKDRDGRVALAGSPASLSQRGTYAIIGDGQAVVLPRTNGGDISVGSGRYGIDTYSRSNIAITGFHFARGAGASGAPSEGVAIRNSRYTMAKNWAIRDNLFGPAVLMNGRGTISLAYVDGADVSGNRFDTLQGGSGLRAGANVRNLAFTGNQIYRVGRTGFYLGGVVDATVKNNIVHDIRGVHGNAMSFYLTNRNITVENNCIYDSDRPITFHGDGKGAASVVNNLIFRNNILIGSEDSVAAISSWGSNTRKVSITGNIAIGGNAGIRLHSSDKDVRVADNRTSGITTQGTTPAAWEITGNSTDSEPEDARGALLRPLQCSMAGPDGRLMVDAR